MPNFITDTFTPPLLPFSEGGYDFLWEVLSPTSHYVLVRKEKVEFFITIKSKDNNHVIKGEKISRPSQVLFLQQALQIYASRAKCNALFSNLKPSKNSRKIKNSISKDINEQNHTSSDEIYIEIGFGSGRHLLYQAKNNPQKKVIGIEIHKPSLEQVARQRDALGLENVVLVDYDSRILMESLPSNSVEKIFVHFPVPWDKKPHRRVISDYFVEEALRVLKIGGALELRTDSELYFTYAVDTFLKNEKADVRIFKNFDLEISSKYEDRWKRLEKNIYDVILRNHQTSVEQEPLNTLHFDFYLNTDKIIDRFSPKLFKGEGFFVHFETLHTKGNEVVVIKTAFGANERAEHSFIIIDKNKAAYFPNNIYATKANKMAHKIIAEWLYE
ncbi:MAG: tRNA (guanosine(46)-N7)-methyltransferase TrmB [Campylobacteraceae bacterium]|jgi:tRNA (guanine-N7-)-methyltransferase|nr:tRNA (guanosine(46)-N7)-methyltransferase TrmB [Campylobacteraceae bacterium]